MKLGGALGNPANELMVFGPDGLCHSSALHGNTWLRRSGEEPGARWGRSDTTFRPMNKASRGRGGWGCPSGVELKLQLQAGFYAMLFAQRQRAISDICGHQRNKCVVACYVFILMRRLFHLLVCSFFLVFLLPWLYSWLSWTSQYHDPQHYPPHRHSHFSHISFHHHKKVKIHSHQPFTTEITITNRQ